MPHFVSGYCKGRKCQIKDCHGPATHKVGEEIPDDDPHQIRHNLTAYVCCEHFRFIMGPVCTLECLDSNISILLQEGHVSQWSGKKLSDIPWDELKIGMLVTVASVFKGNGVITDLLAPPEARDREICITWENGEKSFVWHHQADKVTCL